MDILQLPPPCRLGDSDLLVTLDTVDAAVSVLNAWYWQATADLESRGLAEKLGAKDTTEFLSLRHRRDAAPLSRDVKLGKKLGNYEAVTAALASTADLAPADPADSVDPADPADLSPDSGAADPADPVAGVVLSVAHAQVIIATLEKAPATVTDDELRVAEEQMVEVARFLTPAELRDFGKEVLARLDTDGPEPTDADAYQRESLTLRPVDGGVKFNGYLAAENAELLKTAIHKLSKPHKTIDGERDPRPLDKRQADALTAILEIATGATATPGVPGVPHVTVTIDFADLQKATAAAVGGLVFGDNLSASAVRRLACDAAILPMVLGSESQPLDVGTRKRLATGPIRSALNARDKGCVICHAPPSRCQAHHLVHWADGGPTSITNLVLACKSHHDAIHDGHWVITLTHGVVQVTRPSWTTPAPAGPITWTTPTLWSPPAHPPATADPTHEPPLRPRPTTTPATASSPADGLSWLTPELATALNPWGETGTPSAGP